ncbi:hypothetical protein LSH36_703g01058 [Paralvinella palmiformis]|uniref:ATP synthase subunit g n=1 Tax=Paralvinella palmiformis TaxID=53620 RepID=A0AAD9MTE1_9ANNE|nr:hypothetical protein LSH36_703g01058 [Paralvinella palmiformis]
MAQMVTRVVGKVPQLINGLVDATTPKLQTVWKYARVELRPPSLSELPEVRKGFQDLVKAYRTQKWKQVTVKEAAVNTIVAVEVACWFAIGECIGKRSLVGYQIPGAVNFEAHL